MINKYNNSVIVSFFLSSLAYSVFADGITEPTPKNYSPIRIFGGGGLVFTNNIQAVKSYTYNGATYPYDEVLIASNINGGGNIGIEYDFNSYVAFDFNYTYRGKQDFGVTYQTEAGVDVIGATAQTQSYAFEGVFFFPLQQIKPYVKVGYARYDLRWNHYSGVPGVNINQTAIVTKQGNAVVYSVGSRFPLYKSFDVGFFIDGIYMFNNTSVSTSLSQYYPGINLIYKFS